MFLPRVPPTSDSGTCRTARSSTPDKSEALVVGTSNQLYDVDSFASSISIAGVDLPVAEDMKVLGVFLDRHLTLQRKKTSRRLFGRATIMRMLSVSK